MADDKQPDAPVVGNVDPEAETYSEPQPEPVAPAEPPKPVQVTNINRRSGDDALFGSFVDVVAGEHEGRRGHYFQDVSHGEDGYPDRVLVRTRDADNLTLEVGYDEVRPTDYLGGR